MTQIPFWTEQNMSHYFDSDWQEYIQRTYKDTARLLLDIIWYLLTDYGMEEY